MQPRFSKTTLAGFLAGVALMVLPPVKAKLDGVPNAPPITTNTIITSIGLAVLGKLSSDSDHTH